MVDVGGDYLSFAQALLSALGAPNTPENQAALITWMWAEQSGGPNAAYNPLNIQAGDFPHISTSGSGQYDFASWNDGVQQTANFIRQGFYTGIVSALQTGTDAKAVLDAVQSSPWASGHYGYGLTGQLDHTIQNWDQVSHGAIAGSGGVSTGGTSAPAINLAGISIPNPLDPFGLFGSGSINVTDPLSTIGNSLKAVASLAVVGIKALQFLTDPHEWVRIGMVIAGIGFLFLAWALVNKDLIENIGKVAAVV